MKAKSWKSILTILVLIAGSFVPNNTTQAQVSVNINIQRPAWGPTYHSGVRYYYFPDIQMYYDLGRREFVYFDRGRWIFASRLPGRYASYDLRTGFVVSLNSSVSNPWMRHSYYCRTYPRYYYRTTYRNDYSRMRGYNENDRRPYYHDNGNHNGNDRGRSEDYQKHDNGRGHDNGHDHDNGNSHGRGRR